MTLPGNPTHHQTAFTPRDQQRLMGSNPCGWSPITAITSPYRAADLVVGRAAAQFLRVHCPQHRGAIRLLAWAEAPSPGDMRPQRQQPQQDHDGQGNTRHDQDDLQRRHYLTVTNLPSHRLTRTGGREAVSAVTITTHHVRNQAPPPGRHRDGVGEQPDASSGPRSGWPQDRARTVLR
jgi:hypothetical protein